MIINLISSPRNISTATMYSFAQRSDTVVLDEPFYSYYLTQTDADHPGKEEIISSQPCALTGVADWIQETAKKSTHLFIKNMAHHLIDMDWQFLKEYQNVFLVRNPRQLITSFAKVIENPSMRDIGIERQFDLYEFLSKSQTCPVIDSNEVLKNPKRVLTRLCETLGLSFDPKMLHWEPGPLKEDGVWAKYWYNNVHQSTGFAKQIESDDPLPSHCEALYLQSVPFYEKLFARSIKA